MNIAYVAAGAAGMYCGSCLHDNALAAALMRLGHEVALIPTYTPLRTDGRDVSLPRVFYGAVNVYLQQRWPLFRRLPRPLSRLLDRPGFLTWISRRGASSTDPAELGELTLSVLQGEEGRQARELERLVAWLREELRPDVVHITNSLLSGLARRIKEELAVPVVVSVQGEDLFLQGLPERDRQRVVATLRRRAADADAFIAPSREYARRMAELLAVAPERFAVVPLGVAAGPPEPVPPRSGEPAIGYLARICPEKGLHLLLEAFRELAAEPGREALRLRIAGYLGARDRPFLAEQRARAAAWGLGERVEYVGEVDLAGKVEFLRSLDLLSVPTVYREAKGLFVLEALAHGVPVVQPRHGSFPELLEATGGGLLVEPGSPRALAAGLRVLLDDPGRRTELGRRGREAVRSSFTDEAAARATAAVYQGLLAGGTTRRAG